MYKSYVPDSCPLAREAELQGILAGQGHNNELQLQDEL